MTAEQITNIHTSLFWLEEIEVSNVLRTNLFDVYEWTIGVSGVYVWRGVRHRIVVEGWDAADVVVEAHFAKLAILEMPTMAAT